MKLLIIIFSIVPLFAVFGPRYSPQPFVLIHSQTLFLYNGEGLSFTPM